MSLQGASSTFKRASNQCLFIPNFIFSLIYFSLSFRFLENKAFRRNDLHVSVQDAETIPKVEFFKREENGEKGEKVCTLSIVPTPQVYKFLKSFCYHSYVHDQYHRSFLLFP